MTLLSAEKNEDPGARQGYRAFTTKFDREVLANHLKSVLGPLSPEDEAALDQAWHALQTGLPPWKTRLHITAADDAARIRSCLTDDERVDTVVSLLERTLTEAEQPV
jgi:cobaltochelatase CobT